MVSLPAKLSRYASVAMLLLKHRGAFDHPQPDDPEDLARDLEALGPTFVKLGQLLSAAAICCRRLTSRRSHVSTTN